MLTVGFQNMLREVVLGVEDTSVIHEDSFNNVNIN